MIRAFFVVVSILFAMANATCTPKSRAHSTRTFGGVSLFNASEPLKNYPFGKNGVATKGYDVKNGQEIDLSGFDFRKCESFSIAFWLRASGNAQIISGTSPHAKEISFALRTRKYNNKISLVAVSSARDGGKKKHFGVESTEFSPNEWTHVVLVYQNEGEDQWESYWTFKIVVNMQDTHDEAAHNICNANLKAGDAGSTELQDSFSIAEATIWQRALTNGEVVSLYTSKIEIPNLSLKALDNVLRRIEKEVVGKTKLDDAVGLQLIAKFKRHKVMISNDLSTIAAVLDLITTYENEHGGGLFLNKATKGGLDKTKGSIDNVMFWVQQAALDEIYTSRIVTGCASTLLNGVKWKTARHFPGEVDPPANPSVVHPVVIMATVGTYWGKPTAFSKFPERRTTGLYLPAGQVGTVNVPMDMLGKGFQLLIGAHTSDHSNKATSRRLDRVTTTVDIVSNPTSFVSPLGGGVYVIVPYLSNFQLQDFLFSGGVVKAPHFRSGDTDKQEWAKVKTSSVDWVDFETDHFLMQVPRKWVYGYTFAEMSKLADNWQAAMYGVCDYGGYPHVRNHKVLYLQVDLYIERKWLSIGYPQVNQVYNSERMKEPGRSDHWMVTDPMQYEVEWHETGHTQLPTMYPGEREAIPNLLYCYIQNVTFNMPLDLAFKLSFGPAYYHLGYTPDDAAIHWMITRNFKDGKEMQKDDSEHNQFRYQHRGYAKYVDFAKIFGWEKWRQFHRTENLVANRLRLVFMDDPAVKNVDTTIGDTLSESDSRTLRLSIAAGEDLTPLMHFWGIHPRSLVDLSSRMRAHGLKYGEKVFRRLQHYRKILPRNNKQFLAHYERVYPGKSGKDDNPNYGAGWYHVNRDWSKKNASDASAALEKIIDKYFPNDFFKPTPRPCSLHREGDCSDSVLTEQVQFVAGQIPRDFSKVSSKDTCLAKGVEHKTPKYVFLIAGQSNAEGQVKLEGLRQLAKALPGAGSAKLRGNVRAAGRRAWLGSQGTMCPDDTPAECKVDISSAGCPPEFRQRADAVIAGLRTSTTDWRSFTADGYGHKSVTIRRAQFWLKPVLVLNKNSKPGALGAPKDCTAVPETSPRIGPDLDRYSPPGISPLAPDLNAFKSEVVYGPELSFGDVIGKKLPKSTIVKVTMPGSSLGDHWRLDGPLFSKLVEEAKIALKEQGSVLGGLVWFQGYNDQYADVYCKSMIEPYQQRLERFIEALRRNLSALELPVVIVKARNDTLSFNGRPGQGKLSQIRVAQSNVAKKLDQVTTVESTGLSTCFHYDSGAQIIIGERAGVAMLETMNLPKEPSWCKVYTAKSCLEWCHDQSDCLGAQFQSETETCALKMFGDNITTTTANVQSNVLSATCGELRSCLRKETTSTSTTTSMQSTFVSSSTFTMQIAKDVERGQRQVSLNRIDGLQPGDKMWINKNYPTQELVEIASLLDQLTIQVVQNLQHGHKAGEPVFSMINEEMRSRGTEKPQNVLVYFSLLSFMLIIMGLIVLVGVVAVIIIFFVVRNAKRQKKKKAKKKKKKKGSPKPAAEDQPSVSSLASDENSLQRIAMDLSKTNRDEPSFDIVQMADLPEDDPSFVETTAELTEDDPSFIEPTGLPKDDSSYVQITEPQDDFDTIQSELAQEHDD